MNISELNAASRVQGIRSDAGSGVESLGRKGDIIEGIVRKVSDKVSIDFNGKEMEFSRKTVSDAREGSSIKFQIMDVSDDRIVLKALGNPEAVAASQSAGIISTQLGTGSAVTGAGNQSSEESSDDYSNINNITEDDIKSADGELSELEEYNLEAFDRLLESIKSKRMLESEALEGQTERMAELEKTIERTVLKNKLPDGVSKALAEYFIRYDIPVTKDRLEQIGVAYNQASGIEGIDDKTVKYMLQSELPITISNLYNASYMGNSVVLNGYVDEKVYEELRPQIENIIKASGYSVNDDSMSRAKWLFANDIPVNRENLDRQDILLGIKDNGLDIDMLTDTIMKSVSESQDPSKTVIFDSEADSIRQAVYDINNIEMEAVETVVNENLTMCLESLREVSDNLKTAAGDKTAAKGVNGRTGGSVTVRSITETRTVTEITATTDIRVVTARRQLEEIRLKMTIESARILTSRGIDIDTTELEGIVEGLRRIEREGIQNSLEAQGITITDEEAEVITETMDCRQTIAEAPAYVMGMTRQLDFDGEGNLLSYAETAGNESLRAQRAGAAYETLMTAPRSDMGDSIQKAFANVDDLIRESGLEVTEANQRIVRILAHNRMEISADNIELMQDYDSRMQYMLKGLTPETTYEIIRQGYNPLYMSLDELNTVIAGINENMSDNRRDNGESSYSRFLWKLEKEDRITEEERESYIGICRLIRHVSKNDNAALGAVVNAGMELTLKNLMTTVRSRRDSGMDEKIDDSYAGRDSRVIKDIDEQINTAYEINKDIQTENRIYSSITPSALYEISEGNIDSIMNMTLEELADRLEEAGSEDNDIDNEYYKTLAREIAEGVNDKKAMEFIKAFDMEPSIFSLNAVRQIMSSGQTVLADMLGISKEKDKNYNKKTVSDYEEAVNGLVDALEDEDTMQEQSEKVTSAARRLLEETEHGIIKNTDIDRLRLMSTGIRMNRLMSDRRSYEIPIATESGITNINLTLVKDDTGKSMVNIRMNTETYGNVSIEYSIHGDRLQGLILTEYNVQGIEELYNDAEDAARDCGYNIVSFNRGIHGISGPYIPDAAFRSRHQGITDYGRSNNDRADTADMYRLSKNIIHRISSRL